MNLTWIAKQMVNFQEAIFNNSYNALVMMQDQTEKAANTLLEQAAWIPQESKRLVNQWNEMYKKGQDDLKAALDNNFNKAKDIFGQE